MGYSFADGGGGDQVFLMPPDPRDWLPEGHLAWAMRRAAGGGWTWRRSWPPAGRTGRAVRRITRG
jgi:hypothetical protein